MAERTLNDICIIAKQAGLILREGYEKSHDIKQKTRQDDLVTEMDKKSEDFILERLGTLYPDDMIVTEETGTHTGDAEHVWYIDPCDGTMNYAHGLQVPFLVKRPTDGPIMGHGHGLPCDGVT